MGVRLSLNRAQLLILYEAVNSALGREGIEMQDRILFGQLRNRLEALIDRDRIATPVELQPLLDRFLSCRSYH